VTRRFAALAGRVAYDGKDPWALHWRARTAHAAGEDVIVLSVGDPDLDTPPAVVAAAVARLQGGDTHYTESDGRLALRTAIAAMHVERTGQPVGPANVIFVAGAQNGLFVAAQVLLEAGDEVITFDPLYATYPATLQVSGARLVTVPAPAARGFHPDLEALARAITPRTRAIFLATPGNPSGIVLGDAELDAIAALAERHGLWVVADEVYAGIADGGRVPSIGARLPGRALTVGSLSKTHAMTGWRAGWVVGPEDFIQHAHMLAQCMTYGLPGFIQEAALVAVNGRHEAEAAARDYCRTRREAFHAALADLPGVSALKPDAGMFMLLDVRASGLGSGEFALRLYEAEGVALLEGAVFGRETEGFVRACYATELPVLADAALRIRRFCARLCARA
jgi:polar amino acid transport system ATP-binding protein/arginine:pyruvate transaminase